EREKALAAGMTDYITKPVTITRLVRMMAKYLETRVVTGATTRVSREPSSQPLRRAQSRNGASSSPAEGPSPLDQGVRRSPTVVKLFRQMVPDQLAGLKEAIESGDSTEVKLSAHKLKGGCLALGARRMGSLCADLEPLPDNAHQLFKELEMEHQIVLEALAAELGD